MQCIGGEGILPAAADAVRAARACGPPNKLTTTSAPWRASLCHITHATDTVRVRPCRVSWLPLLVSSRLVSSPVARKERDTCDAGMRAWRALARARPGKISRKIALANRHPHPHPPLPPASVSGCVERLTRSVCLLLFHVNFADVGIELQRKPATRVYIGVLNMVGLQSYKTTSVGKYVCYTPESLPL